MAITGPQRPTDYPDRFSDCEQAIEAELQALIALAMKAGWGEAEACVAIGSLADHHVLSMLANEQLDMRISAGDCHGIVLQGKR